MDRDRVAAYMVRAAVSGVIDYTGADPKNRHWRIKHLLTLTEMARREDYELLTAAHRHWLALVAHGGLTEESFTAAKTQTATLMQEIKTALFPWVDSGDEAKPDPKNSIMGDKDTQDLIARYKELYGDEK